MIQIFSAHGWDGRTNRRSCKRSSQIWKTDRVPKLCSILFWFSATIIEG